jgi:glycosyltransferase involved in cell wall biosynthesis
VRRLGDRRKVSVLPNAIDPDGFPTLSAEQRLRFRRQLGVPASAQALLHLGRNWEIKGGQVFLDALAILVAEGISVVGLFNQAGVEARRHIERRGLGDSVKMIGLMPDPQVLYGAADALVAPSRGETMPYAVMEALCSGTPVVASDLPGHTVLGDALDACAIVPRDAGQVAAASRSFLEMDAAERAAQCHAAREWIAAHFGLETAVERLIEDYRGTLDGSAEPRGLPGPAR